MLLGCLAGILGLGLIAVWLLCPALRRHGDLTRLEGAYIAHRGLHNLSDGIPENSLAAFAAAVRAGFAIENDIRLTADGEVIVFHDETLERMCGVKRRPEEMTLPEIKQLFLAGTREKIPTLAECLAVVQGRVPLLIEFKSPDAALCRAAEAVLHAYRGTYLIQSFYPAVPAWYRRHRPAVCRGQLAAAFRGGAWPRRLQGCLVTNVIARPDFISYRQEDAAHPCRRFCTWLGAFPIGWTFRRPEEVERHRQDFRTYIFEGFLPRM